MKLEKEQIDQFYETGWFIIRSLFRSEEINKILSCFDHLFSKAQELRNSQEYKESLFVLDEGPSEVAIKRVVWAGGYQPGLLTIARDPRLVGPASQLLGSDELDHLLNQAHFKMPGDNVEFPWHQDIEHRSKTSVDWRDLNGRGSYVQTLMALDPMSKDNGPVKFIPESHKWGRIDLGGDGYDSPTKFDQLDTSSAITLTMGAGDVAFFGPYAVHGSFANQSQKARRVLINGYAYPGANGRIYPGSGAGQRLKVPT